MEFRRRSLWNRVWDEESLSEIGREEYVRRIYEGEGGSEGGSEGEGGSGGEDGAWREIGYGLVLSAWKGVRWIWGGLGLDRLWGQEQDLVERDEEPV